MLKQILADELRLLTFRPTSSAIAKEWKAYLFVGLLFTWLAGVGRYWDNPRAELWQWLGLGSVAYVFLLSVILWLLLAPLRPKNWHYRNVLTFVTLTAPPAALYAIPVERFMSASQAVQANAWFLAGVAVWRVGLLGAFLIVLGLAYLSFISAPVLGIAYIVCVVKAWTGAQEGSSADAPPAAGAGRQ